MDEVITVDAGETITYRTQKGAKYQPKTKCSVEFKPGEGCSAFEFSCSEFDIANTKKECAGGQDRLMIYIAGKKGSQTYVLY